MAGEVEVFVYVHRGFSHELVSERILKIGPHLLKLLSLSNIKGQAYAFLGTQCRSIFRSGLDSQITSVLC